MNRISIAKVKAFYKSGTITPQKLIEQIIEASNVDEEYNIWIIKPDLSFIQPYLDELINKSPEQCPLWGVPFAIKDNIDIKGLPTTAACPGYAYEAKEDAIVVKRLLEAGAIPVGKTNLDQFATGLVGTRSPYGEVHNAIKPELISGGSSAGSAVAVARGLAAFSLGTDTAGSGRVPAALNELVGLKPTVGAWPTKGAVPACASLDCITVMANALEDVYMVDSIARGYEETDCWSKKSEIPEASLPIKILLPEEEPVFYGDYAKEYRAAWHTAVVHIKQCGIPIATIDYNFLSKAAKLLYEGPCVAERWADLGEYVAAHPDQVFPVTKEILNSPSKKNYDATSVYKTQHQLREYKHKAYELMKDAVLVMPTCGGTWTREQVRNNPIVTNSDMGRYTNHCNLLDMCAIAIPGERAAEDIPFGITLFATAPNEGLIKGLAQQLMS